MEKIWLDSYPPGVPENINPDLYSSLVQLFTDSCRKYAQKPAYWSFGNYLNYQQLQNLAKNFASFLGRELKLTKGQRLVIMLPNCLQYPVALFGALQAGLVVVNMNPFYTVRELATQLRDCEPAAILTLENFAQMLEQVGAELELPPVIITKLGDLLPKYQAVVLNCVNKYWQRNVPGWKISGALNFGAALQRGQELGEYQVELNGQDLAFLQYTGGTEGVPVGVLLTHRNMVANVLQAASWVQHNVVPGEELVITALPLYHIFSLTANCLIFTFFGGCNALVINPRDLKQFIKILARLPFTALTGVNTLFKALMAQPRFAELKFSHFKFALGGGMAIEAAVAEQWKNLTGVTLIEAYGLTEAAPAVCINPLNLEQYNGAVGLPISSTEVAIIDRDENELEIGSAGELIVKGPQVMAGYWRNELATQQAFTKNGWLKTGDLATIDAEGFVRIVGRKKDLILVSGFNVYPREIESLVTQHPKVLEAAAIGVPDLHSGEVVKLFVVPKDLGLTKEELLEYCHENLAGYKVPKHIEFMHSLPKTNVGKVARQKLRNLK